MTHMSFSHICVHTVTICKSYKHMTLGDFGLYIDGVMFLIYAFLRHAVCTNKLLCVGQTLLHLTYSCGCCVEISRFHRLVYDVYLSCYRPKLDCCICHRQSMQWCILWNTWEFQSFSEMTNYNSITHFIIWLKFVGISCNDWTRGPVFTQLAQSFQPNFVYYQ